MLTTLLAHMCISFFNPISNMTVNSPYNITWNTDYKNDTYLYLYHKHEGSIFGDSLSTYENNQPVLKHVTNDGFYIWSPPHRLNSYNLTDDIFKLILTNNDNLVSQTIDSKATFFYTASNYFKMFSDMSTTFNYVSISPNSTYNFSNTGFRNYTLILQHYDTVWKACDPSMYSYTCMDNNCVFTIVVTHQNQYRFKLIDYPNITRYTNSFHVMTNEPTASPTLSPTTQTTTSSVSTTSSLTTTKTTSSSVSTTSSLTTTQTTSSSVSTTSSLTTTQTTSSSVSTTSSLTTSVSLKNKRMFVVDKNTTTLVPGSSGSNKKRNLMIILFVLLVMICGLASTATYYFWMTDTHVKVQSTEEPQAVTVTHSANPMYDSSESLSSQSFDNRLCVNAVYDDVHYT